MLDSSYRGLLNGDTSQNAALLPHFLPDVQCLPVDNEIHLASPARTAVSENSNKEAATMKTKRGIEMIVGSWSSVESLSHEASVSLRSPEKARELPTRSVPFGRPISLTMGQPIRELF